MKVTDELKDYMKALRDKGLSYTAIARICKCSITTVRRWTNPEYKAKVVAASLRWYHSTKNTPEKKAKNKARRKERYDRTGLQ